MAKGILPFCTVYSNGDKINLNAAPIEVLKAIPGMTNEMIQRIVDYRDLNPTERIQSIAGWLGSDLNVIAPYITTEESNVYSIDAMGYKDNEKRNYTVRATVAIEGAQKCRMIYFRSPATMGS